MATHRSILRRADESGVFVLVMRLFLGGLFVSMGVQKIGHPDVFLKMVRLYEMLPESPAYLLNATALFLPWLEVVCGIALILGIATRGAALAVGGMLCVFTPAILMRALAIRATDGTPFMEISFDCGCGSGPVIIWTKLLNNSGLALLSLIVLIARSRRFTLAMLLDGRRAVRRFCRLCGFPLSSAGSTSCPCNSSGEAPMDHRMQGGATLIQQAGETPPA